MIREPLIGSYARYPNIPKYHFFVLGHVACRLPLRDVASHVGVKLNSYSIEHYTLLEDFRDKKKSTIIKYLFKFHQYE